MALNNNKNKILYALYCKFALYVNVLNCKATKKKSINSLLIKMDSQKLLHVFTVTLGPLLPLFYAELRYEGVRYARTIPTLNM